MSMVYMTLCHELHFKKKNLFLLSLLFFCCCNCIFVTGLYYRDTIFTEKFKESPLRKFRKNFSQKFIKSSEPTHVFATNPNQLYHRADSVYVAYSRDSADSNSNKSDRSSEGNNSGLARLSVRDDSFTDLRESLLES